MKIKTYRSRLHLTQQDLAERIGTTQQTIARWESGKAGVPTKYLKDLAIFLGCSITQLVDDDGIRKREIIEEDNTPYGTAKLSFNDDGTQKAAESGTNTGSDNPNYEFPVSESERVRILNQLSNYEIDGIERPNGWINFSTLDNRFVFLNSSATLSIELLSDDVSAMPAYEHEEVYKALPEIDYLQNSAASESENAPYSDALLKRCEDLRQSFSSEEEDFYVNNCLIVETVNGSRHVIYAEDEAITEIKGIELVGEAISSNVFVNLHSEGWHRSKHFRLSSLRLIVVPLLHYYRDLEEEEDEKLE